MSASDVFGAGGLPGGFETWKVGDDWFAVYFVPDSDVPLMYRFERDDLRDAAGATEADKTLTDRQAQARGAIEFGVTSELDAQLGEHPWDSFLARIERDADIQPWLNDPEVVAHVASAWLRGTTPNLERTDWWQSRTDRERQWLEQAAANPTQARQELEDGRRGLRDVLRDSGVGNVPTDIVNLLADNFTRGHWSEGYTEEQARRLADPFAPGELDQELRREMARVGVGGDQQARMQGSDAVRARIEAIYGNRGVRVPPNVDRQVERVMDEGADYLAQIRAHADRDAVQTGGRPGGFEQTRQEEDTVRDELARWLGPVHGSWSEGEVRSWAGRLRNDPDGQIKLEEHLKGLRQAAFPNWTNENVTYDQIAQVTNGLFRELWNETPNEQDPLFMKVANMTDHDEAARLLRREGWDRGVGPVHREAVRGAMQATGGQIRQAV